MTTFKSLGFFSAIVLGICTSSMSAAEWTTEAFLGSWRTDSTATSLVRSCATNRLKIAQLSSIRTPAAQAALLRIAYGELGEPPSPQAADLFVQTLADKKAARALLVADHPDVIRAGLRALIGSEIDPPLFNQLTNLLCSSYALVRGATANMIAADPSSPPPEAASWIVASMNSTQACRDATNLLAIMDWECKFSTWEFALGQQAQALGAIRWDASSLPSSNAAAGAVVDFLKLAKFLAGDRNAREAVRQVLLESPSPWARVQALLALTVRHPAPEDMSAIRLVASSDPFACAVPRGRLPHDTVYPLRQAATRELDKLRQTRN